ncbi:MAG TPA: hypothetical protein ENK57_19910 [Polyangiaceae bacterium]|nr:hypothetical protein [Polyangiaceae bacterium]
MLWFNSLDAGPLTQAAGRFLAEHPGAPTLPFERGVRGLSALTAAVERWADSEPSDLDDGFVEGCGALLALVLLDHVGDGGYVCREEAHRVRLGEYGFVDPFSAVREALEADDPREAIVSAVSRAEAEASGRAGVGRATRLLAETLLTRRPGLHIEQTFGVEVTLNKDIRIDLTRVLRATDDQPEQTARLAIEKLVTMLPRAGDEARPSVIPLAEVEGRLLPRITAPGFARSLQAHGTLASAPRLEGAIEITLVVAHEDRSRYVAAHELLVWGMSFEQALALAIGNLAQRSENARFARIETDAGAMVMARTRDGLDAARLLLPTLEDVIGQELGRPFLVAIPHRDTLLACADRPELVEALRERAADDAAHAPHKISERLFRIEAGRISLARP